MQRWIATTVSAILIIATTVNAAELSGSFVDDDGDVHEENIEAIAAIGVTRGCNPPANHHFCPDDSVTRGQMAAFLVRALGLPAASEDWFIDDQGSVFEADINALFEAGITRGCNPPDNDRYCPDEPVTRDQMAAFLQRAFGYAPPGSDSFVDDDGSLFEAQIEALAAAGVTRGCNPPDNDRYCPGEPVTRSQMASFLARALELDPIVPGVPEDPGDSVNCTTFETWREAQEWFDLYAPHYGDVAHLDGNGDGVACESLPGAP